MLAIRIFEILAYLTILLCTWPSILSIDSNIDDVVSLVNNEPRVENSHLKSASITPRILFVLPQVNIKALELAGDVMGLTKLWNTLDSTKVHVTNAVSVASTELENMNKGEPVFEVALLLYMINITDLSVDSATSTRKFLNVVFQAHKNLNEVSVIGSPYKFNFLSISHAFFEEGPIVCFPFNYTDASSIYQRESNIFATTYSLYQFYNSVGKWVAHIGWDSILIVLTDPDFFDNLEAFSARRIAEQDYKIRATVLLCNILGKSEEGARSCVEKVKRSGIRVVFLISHEYGVTHILVEAFRMELIFPKYIWISTTLPVTSLATQVLNNEDWIDQMLRSTILINQVQGGLSDKKYEDFSREINTLISNNIKYKELKEYILRIDGTLGVKNHVYASNSSIDHKKQYGIPYPSYIMGVYSCIYQIIYKIYCVDAPSPSKPLNLNIPREVFCDKIRLYGEKRQPTDFAHLYVYNMHSSSIAVDNMQRKSGGSLSHNEVIDNNSYETSRLSKISTFAILDPVIKTRSLMENEVNTSKSSTVHNNTSTTGNYLNANFTSYGFVESEITQREVTYTPFNIITQDGNILNTVDGKCCTKKEHPYIAELRKIRASEFTAELMFFFVLRTFIATMCTIQLLTLIPLIRKLFTEENKLYHFKSTLIILGHIIEFIFCYMCMIIQGRGRISCIIVTLPPPISVILIFTGLILKSTTQPLPRSLRNKNCGLLREMGLPVIITGFIIIVLFIVKIAMGDFTEINRTLSQCAYSCSDTVSNDKVTCSVIVYSLEAFFVITFIIMGGISTLGGAVIYRNFDEKFRTTILVYKHLIFYIIYYFLAIIEIRSGGNYRIVYTILFFMSGLAFFLLFTWSSVFKMIFNRKGIMNRDKNTRKYSVSNNTNMHTDTYLRNLGMLRIENISSNIAEAENLITIRCLCKFYRSKWFFKTPVHSYIVGADAKNNRCTFRRIHRFLIVDSSNNYAEAVEVVSVTGIVIILNSCVITESVREESEFYELNIYTPPFIKTYVSIRFHTSQDHQKFTAFLSSNSNPT